MKNLFSFSVFLILFAAMSAQLLPVQAQTANEYTISFENRMQNEAEITAVFKDLNPQTLEIRMSRSSPGRYALHEFAKNVYGAEAFDSKGNKLPVSRPNLHQWDVSGHDGTVVFKYTLYANHGDGTYAQVDETHAHLNIPAVFVTARDYGHRPVEVTFNIPEGENWQTATQLKHLHGNTYYAPDTYYFMDSPVELAEMHFRNRKVGDQNIRMALHTRATEAEIDAYFEKVMDIVNAQIRVFGKLPALEYGEYTFLLCFMPNATRDGMEHRNSTTIPFSKPFNAPLGETGISIVSHEFIHTWSTERLRPRSLEPFNFEEANMSGELWFSEGFTNYYTSLILARTGITEKEEYIKSLGSTVSYVINSPGRQYFNPIEMSYQAPFTDAARSVDPTNRANTFISYYTYGSVLGLGLDLELRSMGNGKNLDRFMQLMWQKYGEDEIPYTVRDIQSVLAEYTSEKFAANFFEKYIFDSQLPDFSSLFKNVGILFEQTNRDFPDLGGIPVNRGGVWRLLQNPRKDSPVYKAGINMDDEFVSIGGIKLSNNSNLFDVLNRFKPGQKIEIMTRKWGEERKYTVTLEADASFSARINPNAAKAETDRRTAWLEGRD